MCREAQVLEISCELSFFYEGPVLFMLIDSITDQTCFDDEKLGEFTWLGLMSYKLLEYLMLISLKLTFTGSLPFLLI